MYFLKVAHWGCILHFAVPSGPRPVKHLSVQIALVLVGSGQLSMRPSRVSQHLHPLCFQGKSAAHFPPRTGVSPPDANSISQ